jgi:hypothetical protein
VADWRDPFKELTEIKVEAYPEESQPRLRSLDLQSLSLEELSEEIPD